MSELQIDHTVFLCDAECCNYQETVSCADEFHPPHRFKYLMDMKGWASVRLSSKGERITLCPSCTKKILPAIQRRGDG